MVAAFMIVFPAGSLIAEILMGDLGSVRGHCAVHFYCLPVAG
jgi:hypothetical protein